jgi:hypothetical protein
VLVWFQENKRGARLSAIGFGGVLAVLLTLSRGTAWLSQLKYWPAWVFVVLCMLAVYFFARRARSSAGADWLARGNKFVRTYELVRVTCHTYHPTGASLYLWDAGGRKLRYKLIDFSIDDRLLWDLTYNGILHSVIAGGAKTNRLARRTLALPSTGPAPGVEQEEPSPDQ